MVLAKVGRAACRAMSRDLGLVRLQRRGERRLEVLRLDPVEGRQPERRRPFGEQRVAALGRALGRRRRSGPCAGLLGPARRLRRLCGFRLLRSRPLGDALRHRPRHPFREYVLIPIRNSARRRQAWRRRTRKMGRRGPALCALGDKSITGSLPIRTRSIGAAPGGWGAENPRHLLGPGLKATITDSQSFEAVRCSPLVANLSMSGKFGALASFRNKSRPSFNPRPVSARRS